MRILQINTSDRGGGAEAVSRLLHEGYRARGHAATLAVGIRRTTLPGVIEIPRHRSPWTHFWARVQRSALRRRIRVIPRLAAALAPINRLGRAYEAAWQRGEEDFFAADSARLPQLLPARPDIIHAHNLHGGDGYFNLGALPALSAYPLVLTLHDAWLLSGHCAHSLDCERWRTGCGECPDLALYPAISRDTTAENWRRRQALFARSRLHVATPSRWLMAKVENSMLRGGMVAGRVIPNGVDLSLFKPAERTEARATLGLSREACVLLFSATGIRESAFKDFESLRRAVALIGDRLPEREVLFLALGEGGPPEQIGRATIQFVPYESDMTRVATYYQAADVYIHAARADTFPNVVLEAMACGCPIVATAVGGIPEQIEHGETGMLAAAASHDSLAEQAMLVLGTPTLAATIGASAVAKARRCFDINRTIDAYVAWFEEILACRSPGAARAETSATAGLTC